MHVRLCARVSGMRSGILRPSGYWLSWNDEGDDGGRGGGLSQLEFLFISPQTPTVAWLPRTHMIKHHDAGTDAFFCCLFLFSSPVLLSRGCALS